MTAFASPVFPSLNSQRLRVLAFGGTACILVVGWLEGHFVAASTWLALGLLLYPAANRLVALPWQRYYSKAQIAQLQLFFDALLIGVLMSWMRFSIVPCMVHLVLLGFYSLLRWQAHTLLLVIALVSLGASLSQLLLNSPLQLDSPPLTSLVSLLVLLLQLLYLAGALRSRLQRMHGLERELANQQGRFQLLAQDLSKYLSPQIWQVAFTGQSGAQIPTRRKKLTVFFSDIKGFTDLSEELEPEDLAALLNSYLSAMSDIAARHGGTVDKFVGDSIMVFFGDPHTQGAKQDALAAVAMALDMRKQMFVLRQQWQSLGVDKQLEIRMGINTGYCTAGSFGADSRMDYTLIGREVNLASRLESAASANEILISAETYNLVKDVIMGRDKGQLQVKGFARPVQIYQVVDYRSNLGPGRSYLTRELPGFSLRLDTSSLQPDDIQQVVQSLQESLQQLGK